jgi:hypothetical protein
MGKGADYRYYVGLYFELGGSELGLHGEYRGLDWGDYSHWTRGGRDRNR